MSTPSPIRRFGAAARVARRATLAGALLLGTFLAVAPAAAQAADSDGDGLYDIDETSVYFTDPYNWDSDGDGASDGAEVYYGTDPTASARPDSDGDGLYDDDELAIYGTNPGIWDTDGDGTSDGAEVYYGTDPRAGGDYATQCVSADQFGNTGNLQTAPGVAAETVCDTNVQQSSAASSD